MIGLWKAFGSLSHHQLKVLVFHYLARRTTRGSWRWRPINRERCRVWRVCRPRCRATGQSVANGPDRCDRCVF
jgi:hypothetical protein